MSFVIKFLHGGYLTDAHVEAAGFTCSYESDLKYAIRFPDKYLAQEAADVVNAGGFSGAKVVRVRRKRA